MKVKAIHGKQLYPVCILMEIHTLEWKSINEEEGYKQ